MDYSYIFDTLFFHWSEPVRRTALLLATTERHRTAVVTRAEFSNLKPLSLQLRAFAESLKQTSGVLYSGLCDASTATALKEYPNFT